MSDDTIPEPDRLDGAPHPRETPALYGQHAAEAAFLDAFTAGRMHSGWLITGPRGVGKATLAWKIATFLLADAPPDMLGGVTLAVPADHPDARLVQSGAHPRLALIRRPWDEKTDIIATMNARVIQGEFRSGYGIGINRRFGPKFILSTSVTKLPQQGLNMGMAISATAGFVQFYAGLDKMFGYSVYNLDWIQG